MMQQYLTTGQVAKSLRVSISTLKRWLDSGEVAIEQKRNHNGWRLFSDKDVEALREYKKVLKKSGKKFTKKTLVPVR